jgi:hypothetical protein
LSFVDFVNHEAPGTDRFIGIRFNSPLSMEGWAFDERNRAAGEALHLVFASDSGVFHFQATRTRREDLPSAYPGFDVLNSGFRVHIERLCIPHDTYSLQLIEIGPAGYVRHDLGMTLAVTAQISSPSPHLLQNISQGATTGRIDSIAGKPTQNGSVLPLPPQTKAIVIQGWSIDPDAKADMADVYLAFEDDRDGTTVWVRAVRYHRADVTLRYGLPEKHLAGFRANVNTDDLPGRFTVRVALASSDGLRYLSHRVRVDAAGTDRVRSGAL